MARLQSEPSALFGRRPVDISFAFVIGKLERKVFLCIGDSFECRQGNLELLIAEGANRNRRCGSEPFQNSKVAFRHDEGVRKSNNQITASSLRSRRSSRGVLKLHAASGHPPPPRFHPVPSGRSDARLAHNRYAGAAAAGKWRLCRIPPPA
jgi:hypothetical protein